MSNTHCSPRAAVAAILASQFCIISRTQARRAGLTARQIQWLLETGEWIRVHEAVYRLAAAPVTPEQQLMGAILATSGYASHRSAGLLDGLEVPVPPHPEVATTRRRELDGISVHRTRRLVATQLDHRGPFTTTRPGRTLIDLAGVLSPWHLEAAVDSALRTELITLDALERCIDAHGARGFHGVALLRELIASRRTFGVPRSQLENRVWKLFDQADCETPMRNVVVYDEHGRRLGEIDLSWPWARVGIECQSYTHHFGRNPWRADIVKANRFTAAGWAIFPATEEEAGPKFHILLRQVVQALELRRSAARGQQ